MPCLAFSVYLAEQVDEARRVFEAEQEKNRVLGRQAAEVCCLPPSPRKCAKGAAPAEGSLRIGPASGFRGLILHAGTLGDAARPKGRSLRIIHRRSPKCLSCLASCGFVCGVDFLLSIDCYSVE